MARKFLLSLFMAFILIICVFATNFVLDGIWYDNHGTEYRFENGYWQIWAIDDNEPMSKGYHSINDSKIIKTTTHVYVDGRWLARNTLNLRAHFAAEFELDETQLDGVLDIMFSPRMATFSNDGNTLIITTFDFEIGITIITTIINRKQRNMTNENK